MKKSFFLFSFVLVLVVNASSQSTITTFILVRHAEKVLDSTEDPDLTPEGVERAARLAALLEMVSINAIYSTPLKRTRNTVTALATAKKLDVKVYEAFKEAPIEQILKDHPGGTVVISGHSNNIPWIANLLTGSKQFGEYDDDDYGNILIVDVVVKGKAAKVTWLRY